VAAFVPVQRKKAGGDLENKPSKSAKENELIEPGRFYLDMCETLDIDGLRQHLPIIFGHFGEFRLVHLKPRSSVPHRA
jgi:hypothetical protein